ncbi:antibiotic biosynthesis monooxygenase family protein [Actinocorallia populi]|uniref:antibiotic biosynthesis monooxygenase family protein n=1 Tax=Actinocorallia populi TaxID=2079200 RepID=UPI000D089B9B|nr:antibiotic biosynthesis monooxygenase [Actinocorallia populi]
MSVGFVAFHYPQPNHFEEFVGRAHRVRAFLEEKPGCRSAEVWATPDAEAVVTIVRFETEEALQEGIAAAADLGDVIAYDERERAPRQISMLLSK